VRRRLTSASRISKSGQSVLVNNKHKDTVKSVTDLDKPDFTIVTEQGTTGDVAAQKTFTQATIPPDEGWE